MVISIEIRWKPIDGANAHIPAIWNVWKVRQNKCIIERCRIGETESK